jgi:hypothetical protein
MNCLYRSDYGQADPHFDPAAGGGVLFRGFEQYRAVLSGAQNLGQLDAMKRQVARGEQIQWCDQGYGWTYEKPVEILFDAILAVVIVPWFLWRVGRLARRWARRRVHDRAVTVRAAS